MNAQEQQQLWGLLFTGAVSIIPLLIAYAVARLHGLLGDGIGQVTDSQKATTTILQQAAEQAKLAAALAAEAKQLAQDTNAKVTATGTPSNAVLAAKIDEVATK